MISWQTQGFVNFYFTHEHGSTGKNTCWGIWIPYQTNIFDHL